MTESLDGRAALVAGATRGAGRGIAVGLGEAGAAVCCFDVTATTSGTVRLTHARRSVPPRDQG